MATNKIYLLIDYSQIHSFGVRHFQALLLFLCMASYYLLYISLTTVVSIADFKLLKAEVFENEGTKVAAVIFHYFYIASCFIFGYIGTKINNKILLFYGLLYSSLATFSLPFLLYYENFVLFVIIRITLGISQGIVVPMIAGHIARWYPPYERATFAAFIFAAKNLSITGHKIYTGLIYSGVVKWSSYWMFTGITGLMVSAVWGISGAHEPSCCKYISESEKVYINEYSEVDPEIIIKKVKWKKMLTNRPFYALLIAHLGNDFCFHIVLNKLPEFFYHIFGVEIREAGAMASVPFIVAMFSSIPVAFVADLLIRKRILALEFTKKVFNTIGMFGNAFCIVFCGYANDRSLSIYMYALTTSFNVFVNIGVFLNNIEIAPNFATLVMGFSEGVASLSNQFSPLVFDALVCDKRSYTDWSKLLIWTAVIFAFSNVVFVVFGSCSIQSFNDIDDT